MLDLLVKPWPWYVTGPMLGLMVPLLLLVGNKLLGFSANFRHACAAVLPGRASFFRYDWRGVGGWNLLFGLGVLIGAVIAGRFLLGTQEIAIAAATRADLLALGLTDMGGLVPAEIFSWGNILTTQGLTVLVGGGFLVGFGTAYAGGCTSGHGIAGLADFQLPSLIAVVGFFVGGLIGTHLLLPLIF